MATHTGVAGEEQRHLQPPFFVLNLRPAMPRTPARAEDIPEHLTRNREAAQGRVDSSRVTLLDNRPVPFLCTHCSPEVFEAPL
jgi:hypothetical protein